MDEYVLDTPTCGRSSPTFTRRSHAASSPEAACDGDPAALRRAARRPGLASGEYRADAPESGMGGGIGQWLLYRAGDGSLSLFALVIPPGAETPVHDHLAWGLVGLYRGTQDEEIYARRDGAPRAGRAPRARAGRLLRADPAHRRHPPRAHNLGRDLRLDPPADERHRLRLAPRVRPRLGERAPVPVGLRQRRLRGGRHDRALPRADDLARGGGRARRPASTPC